MYSGNRILHKYPTAYSPSLSIYHLKSKNTQNSFCSVVPVLCALLPCTLRIGQRGETSRGQSGGIYLSPNSQLNTTTTITTTHRQSERLLLNNRGKMSDLRQRQVAPEKQQQQQQDQSPATPSKDKKNSRKNARVGISVLDILRVLVTLLVASCGLSYYVTSSESFLWGYRPWCTKWPLVVQYFVSYRVLPRKSKQPRRRRN